MSFWYYSNWSVDRIESCSYPRPTHTVTYPRHYRTMLHLCRRYINLTWNAVLSLPTRIQPTNTISCIMLLILNHKRTISTLYQSTRTVYFSRRSCLNLSWSHTLSIIALLSSHSTELISSSSIYYLL